MASSFGIITCLLAASLPWTTSYPNGPPVTSYPALCKDMFPIGHGVPATNGSYPYEIVTRGGCYKEDVDIPVFIRVNKSDDSQPYFEGLLLMARTSGETGIHTDNNHGVFDVRTDEDLTTYDCFNKQNSAIGHTRAGHSGCKQVYWRSSPGLTGPVIFQATVVRNQLTFWMNITSPVLTYDPDCVIPDDDLVTCHVGPGNESYEEISGSDVLRAMVTTTIGIALVALIMYLPLRR